MRPQPLIAVTDVERVADGIGVCSGAVGTIEAYRSRRHSYCASQTPYRSQADFPRVSKVFGRA